MFKSRFHSFISQKFLNCNYSNSFKSLSIKYVCHGDPLKVLDLSEQLHSKKLKDDDILLRFLSAAVHPSDINTIQGQYPIRPQLPAIVGNEGYAEVLDVGSNSGIKIGDFVVPREMNSGTWTSHKIVKSNEVIKVATKLKAELGAIFCVNPGTAYRMLNDFVTLRNGDVIIQNGATSSVGIYVIQLAKLRNIISINIIRSRSTEEATNAVKTVLKSEYGADYIFTEEELKSCLASTLKLTGMAKLALNCVGGKSILPLLKSLKESGIVVTYGAMNRLPIQVPVSPLIFSDISLKGFWMSRWSNTKKDSRERQEMVDILSDMFHSETIKPSPFELYDFKSQWFDAVTKSMFKDETPEALNKKGIFVMGDC